MAVSIPQRARWRNVPWYLCELVEAALNKPLQIPRNLLEKERRNQLVQCVDGDIGRVGQRLPNPLRPVIGVDPNNGLLRPQIRFDVSNLHAIPAFESSERRLPPPWNLEIESWNFVPSALQPGEGDSLDEVLLGGEENQDDGDDGECGGGHEQARLGEELALVEGKGDR